MGGFVEFGEKVSVKLSNSRFAWLIDEAVKILEEMGELQAADWCQGRSPDIVGVGMGYVNIPEIPSEHREVIISALDRFAAGVLGGEIELDSGWPEFDESVREKMREISTELSFYRDESSEA